MISDQVCLPYIYTYYVEKVSQIALLSLKRKTENASEKDGR